MGMYHTMAIWRAVRQDCLLDSFPSCAAPVLRFWRIDIFAAVWFLHAVGGIMGQKQREGHVMNTRDTLPGRMLRKYPERTRIIAIHEETGRGLCLDEKETRRRSLIVEAVDTLDFMQQRVIRCRYLDAPGPRCTPWHEVAFMLYGRRGSSYETAAYRLHRKAITALCTEFDRLGIL